MLEVPYRGAASEEQRSPFGEINITAIFGFLRRHIGLLVLGVIAGAIGGGAYLLTATPRYTAVAAILVDLRKNPILQSQRMLAESPIDTSLVDSQVEVLKSEAVAQHVIEQLKLANDPEFVGGGSPFFAWASSLIGLNDATDGGDAAKNRMALDAFARRLDIKRRGLTYVIEIGFESEDPEKAALIANAIPNAYLDDDLESKYQSSKRASAWLQQRIDEMRQQAVTADRDVQSFKARNNIVETGRGLVNEQQLSELTSQLTTARAQTGDATAKVDSITKALAAPDVLNGDGSVVDALHNDVITKLRQEYLEDSRKEADWSARYGKMHQAAVLLRANMDSTLKGISDELQRIASTYRSDLEVAKAREAAAQANLNDAIKQSASTNQERVNLRELESVSQTSRTLYDNFLQRYLESTQQESFPTNEARVITPASRPLKKSHPRTLIIAGGSLAGGLLAGLALAFLREQLDRTFRTDRQVRQSLGFESFGYVPLVRRASAPRPATVDAQGRRLLAENLGFLRQVTTEPFGPFAEALRAAKAEIDHGGTRAMQVVSFTSVLAGEGKTTMVGNFAELLASQKQKVILLDLDLRKASLTRALVREPAVTVQDVIEGRATLADAVWRDPLTGLDFIPADSTGRYTLSADLLGSDALRALIADLRSRYDYVLVDLPPIGPVADARATDSFVDAYVLVVEWGKSNIDTTIEGFNSAPRLRSKIVGAILNKTNFRQLSRFDDKRSQYSRAYSSNYTYVNA